MTRLDCGKRFVMMFVRALRRTSLIRTWVSHWEILSSPITTTSAISPGHTHVPKPLNGSDVLQIFGTDQKVSGWLVQLYYDISMVTVLRTELQDLPVCDILYDSGLRFKILTILSIYSWNVVWSYYICRQSGNGNQKGGCGTHTSETQTSR